MKSVFSHISLTILLNALVKPAWILTETWVHNQIGHESWGTYTALLSFAFLFIALSDLGINQYATQKLAGEPDLFRASFPHMLGIKLGLVLFYPLAMVGLGYLWGIRSTELYFLVLLAFIYGGTQLKQFYRANFQAMQAFRIDAFASVTERIILLAFAWILLFSYIDIERFIYARLAAILLSILIFSSILRSQYGRLGVALDSQKVKNLLGASFSFALVTVLYSFLDKVDQVMLEKICGEEETGLYAAAYRWMDAIHMYLIINLTIFFARFAHFISDYEEQGKLLRLAQVMTGLPLMFVSITVFFYGEAFIDLLFTNSTPEEISTISRAFKILFISTMTNGLFMLYSTLLSATGYIRFVNKVVMVGIVLNVAINLYLIPKMGAVGAAWATSLTLTLMGFCYIAFLAFQKKVLIPWGLLFRLMVSGLVLSGVYWVGMENEFHPLLGILLAGIAYLGTAVVLGLIPEELWKRLKW